MTKQAKLNMCCWVRPRKLAGFLGKEYSQERHEVRLPPQELLFNAEGIENRLGEITRALRKARSTRVYVTGSWFLEDCYEYLEPKPNEVMHFVSGFHFGNVFTLDRINAFDLDRQSPGGVSGDLVSSTKALLEIEHHGYRLTGWFHSHPSVGKAGTDPSPIDTRKQQMLESVYPAIGGIFTRDGYVRFFSVDKDFEIRVFGKGVEHVEDRVFRLTSCQDVLRQGDQAPSPSRGNSNRQARPHSGVRSDQVELGDGGHDWWGRDW